MSERCAGLMMAGYSTLYGYRHCPRRGKVQRNGKWYCGTHDPVRCAERQAKRDEEGARSLKAERERREFTSGCEAMCVAAGVTLEDLRQGRVRVMVIPCEAQP